MDLVPNLAKSFSAFATYMSAILTFILLAGAASAQNAAIAATAAASIQLVILRISPVIMEFSFSLVYPHYTISPHPLSIPPAAT